MAIFNLIQVQMHWMIDDRLWLITDLIFKLICKFTLRAEERKRLVGNSREERM